MSNQKAKNQYPRQIKQLKILAILIALSCLFIVISTAFQGYNFIKNGYSVDSFITDKSSAMGRVKYTVQADTGFLVLPATFDYNDTVINGLYFMRKFSIDDSTSYLVTGVNEHYFLGTKQDVVHSLIYTYAVFGVLPILFLFVYMRKRHRALVQQKSPRPLRPDGF